MNRICPSPPTTPTASPLATVRSTSERLCSVSACAAAHCASSTTRPSPAPYASTGTASTGAGSAPSASRTRRGRTSSSKTCARYSALTEGSELSGTGWYEQVAECEREHSEAIRAAILDRDPRLIRKEISEAISALRRQLALLEVRESLGSERVVI